MHAMLGCNSDSSESCSKVWYCELEIVSDNLDVFSIFFFKQKTAYEMRISDWSSDVCSSDLTGHALLQGNVSPGSIAALRRGAARAESRKAADRRACLLAHELVARAADEEEEHEHDGCIEIGMRSVIDRIVETHAEGEQHADGDRHIHVGAPMAERVPGGTEENATRIDQNGQGDGGRDPVEQVAHIRLGARPDRDRQEHDIAGSEAGHRQGADEFKIGRAHV